VDVRGDFLVIGSGIAGLRAALTLAKSGDVIILTKADPGESNTGHAQGGIAAALGPDDSPSLHAQDTIAAGDGLCDPAAVDVLVREGPRYVVELRSIARPTARQRWRARRRTASGGSCTRAMRRGARSAGCSGRE